MPRGRLRYRGVVRQNSCRRLDRGFGAVCQRRDLSRFCTSEAPRVRSNLFVSRGLADVIGCILDATRTASSAEGASKITEENSTNNSDVIISFRSGTNSVVSCAEAM